MLDKKNIGKRIRNARKLKAMNQNELAKSLGVSVSHLSHIETGKNLPSMDVLIQLCKELNQTPNYFLMNEYTPDNNYSFSYFHSLFSNLSKDEQSFLYKVVTLIQAMQINRR